MNKTSMRTLQVLDYISEKGYPLTLKQISEGVNIPPSSTYDIVNTMKSMGYLQSEDKDMKTYYIGLAAFQSGSAYVRDIDFVRIARSYLKKIARKTKCTVFLGIQKGRSVVYLDKVEENQKIKTLALLGKTNELYSTGLGKAILATLPTKKVETLYDENVFQPKTENTVRNLEELKQELFKTRQRGYAVDDEEGEKGIICVAVPIKDYEGNTVAAISAANTKNNLKDTSLEENAQIVINYARKISKELGYEGSDLFYSKEI